MLIAPFHYSTWAFVNGSDTLIDSDRIKCTQVAEVKLCVLLFKQYSSQSQKSGVYKAFEHKKMVFIRLLNIKDTSGMNLRTP